VDKVLSRRFSGVAKENHEGHESGYSASGSRLYPDPPKHEGMLITRLRLSIVIIFNILLLLLLLWPVLFMLLTSFRDAQLYRKDKPWYAVRCHERWPVHGKLANQVKETWLAHAFRGHPCSFVNFPLAILVLHLNRFCLPILFGSCTASLE
jgi:ABC-type glycerol-3-phosphate transport system permease component